MSGRAVDGNAAAETVEPFHDSMESEVSVVEVRPGLGIESTSVVRHREHDRVAVASSADFDMLRLSVSDGVHDEFAHDSQNGVERRFGKPFSWHGDIDRNGAVFDMGRDRFADRLRGVGLVERAVAEIPQSVLQLLSTVR